MGWNKRTYLKSRNAFRVLWCNGSTWGFDPHSIGSIPISTANAKSLKEEQTMLLMFVKIAGVICGFVFGIGLACAVSEIIMGKHRKEFTSRGYDAAVRDIMRYGFYYGADGERHEVENIRIWSD